MKRVGNILLIASLGFYIAGEMTSNNFFYAVAVFTISLSFLFR